MKQKLRSLHYLGTRPNFRIRQVSEVVFRLEEFCYRYHYPDHGYRSWEEIYRLNIETGEDKYSRYWEEV